MSTRRAPALIPAIVLAHLFLLSCAEPPQPLPPPEALSVQVEIIGRGVHQPTLPLLGVVRPRAMVAIKAPRGGRLRLAERFQVALRTGETVSQGEWLATIDNDELDLALKEDESRLRQAEREQERANRSVREGVAAQEKLGAAEHELELRTIRLAATRTACERQILRSPFDGRLVVDESVPAGSTVAAGDVLARVAADGSRLVEAWVAASARSELHVGQVVDVSRAGDEDSCAVGEVSEVASTVESSGTVRVVVRVAQPERLPAPGVGVELRVRLHASSDALTVPVRALLRESGGTSVWVADGGRGGAVARRRVISPGRLGGGRVEILRGLKEGDQVIVGGHELLTDSRSLRVQVVEADSSR